MTNYKIVSCFGVMNHNNIQTGIMSKNILGMIFFLFLLSGCDKGNNTVTHPITCESDHSMDIITTRSFKMGFSTWNFGPDEADRIATYQFITSNADIYSEQIEYKIPWKAWINNSSLPTAFTDDIAYRVSKKPLNHQLLLSVSLLNLDRSNLLEDYDGTIPTYTSMNDPAIENAYYNHLVYLITQFSPNYLVIAMEANELKVKSEIKWTAYKLLMSNIRKRLKISYPNLPLSESVTLHNWYNPTVVNPADYIAEISNYVNQNLDFAAISFYPFLKNLHNKTEFQQAFDFLHAQTKIPIAFVETAHLAENLEISNYNLNIKSDVCEQKGYLETLLLNASTHHYKFIIWWSHRDFDKLWETFPAQSQDIAKLFRNTGLIDKDGTERPSYLVWKSILKK